MKDSKLGFFSNNLIRVKQLVSMEQMRLFSKHFTNEHFRLFPTIRKSIRFFNHATMMFQVGTEKGMVLLFMFLFNQFAG